jgi:hypothetical protein
MELPKKTPLKLVTAFLFIASAAMAQPAATPPTPAVATAMTPTPDDRAKQWLNLVDDGNYAEAWKQAGATLRTHQSADSFVGQETAKRTPMGAMSGRTLKDVKLTKTVAGMRSGQYAVVRYDSAFAHQAAAVESVTLASENGGWSVVGYRIDP